MRRLFLAASAVCLAFAARAEEPATLNEVTVTATGSDVAERREAVSQKVVLERKDIENLGAMTIGEVLGKLPGVEVQGEAQRARGMSRDSVQILIDGERPAGGSRMVAGVISRLPAGELERVEILRGASAEYGGASAITVNLVMKKARSQRKTGLKAAIGLRGEEPTSQFTWTENGGEGGFAWTLPLTLNLHRTPFQTDGERLAWPGGMLNLWQQERENGLFTFREFVLSPRMTWKIGSDSLTVAPLLFDGLGGRDSHTAGTDFLGPASIDRNSHETNRRHLVRVRVEGDKQWGGAKLNGRAAFNRGTRTVDIVRASSLSGSANEHSVGSETEYNFALRLDQPLETHLLAAGVEYISLQRTDQQEFSGSFVGTASSAAGERHRIAWIQDDWSLHPSLVLTGGVRGESVRLAADGVDRQHARLLPSLAVRWEFAPQWLLRTSLGAGLKLPRVEELSNGVTRSVAANTPLEADRRGNPNLLPERSLNYEAVLERYLAREAGVFGANLYVRATEDFIERRVQQEGVRWVERPYNEGRALHWGIELDGKLRTDDLGWKGATLKAHLTLPKARVNDVRLGITRQARETPDYVLSAGVEQSLPQWQSSFGVSWQASGANRTDIPHEQRAVTQARTTIDAFWLFRLNPVFNLRCNVQNLLAAGTVRETDYWQGADHYRLRTEDKGIRTVLVTLEGRW